MNRFRCRRSAAAFAVVLVLVLAPLASATPVVPTAGSWWSTLAVGFDGILGLLGLGETRTVTAHAAEGPGLEPDGSSVQLTDPEADDTTTGDTRTRKGGILDPNG